MRGIGTSWVGNAGYRPYEGLTRVQMIENAAAAVALGVAALAFGGDRLHVVATFVSGAVLFGLIYGWFELRGLRRGLPTARIGALPPGERPLEELAREWRSAPLGAAVRVAVFVALAALADLAFDSFGYWLSFTGAMTAGFAVGQAAVLVWLHRRRRRDGMELYVRELEGAEADEPPRLLLVPRGS